MFRKMEAAVKQPVHTWNFGEDEDSTHDRMIQISKVVVRKDITELKDAISFGFKVNEWFNANPEALKSFNSPAGRTPRHLRETTEEDRIQMLHLATACRWKEGVEELINAGADVNAYDYKVYPELQQTTPTSHHVPFYEPKKSYTPLMHACCYGNVPQVKVLLDNGADPSALDPHSGATPIGLALRFFSYPILKLLLDSGAVFREKDASATPLQEIVEVFNNPKLKVTNAHQYNSDQLAEITEEVRIIALQLMKYFLSYGVDLTVMTQESLPPLHMCAEGCQGDLRGLELLVAHGADVNLVCKGAYYHKHSHMTPLLAAILGENGLPTALWLIQQGANVDQKVARYYRGRSVSDPISILSVALEEGLHNMASVLIRAGCEVAPQDVEVIKGLLSDLRRAEMESFKESGQQNLHIVAAVENIEGLLDFLTEPKNLMWQIRKVLRTTYDLKQIETVNALPLPRPLKNFILCHDL